MARMSEIETQIPVPSRQHGDGAARSKEQEGRKTGGSAVHMTPGPLTVKVSPGSIADCCRLPEGLSPGTYIGTYLTTYLGTVK